ncbi:MAG: hypothetical protein ACNI3H_00800 [Halarcobacter ebronensis]
MKNIFKLLLVAFFVTSSFAQKDLSETVVNKLSDIEAIEEKRLKEIEEEKLKQKEAEEKEQKSQR